MCSSYFRYRYRYEESYQIVPISPTQSPDIVDTGFDPRVQHCALFLILKSIISYKKTPAPLLLTRAINQRDV